MSEGQVRRHETSRSAPTLLVALAYETVFQIPVSAIFVGFRTAVADAVATNLEELQAELERRSEHGKLSGPAHRKMQWLKERIAR
jgi:DNA-binding XRE family transcriptional regulator